MPRLVYVTSGDSVPLLPAAQLASLRKRGFDVVVIASAGAALSELSERGFADTVAIPMVREIRPRQDLVTLLRLYRTFRALRPNIVNAGTPKAGLLGMVAARLAGVPIRVYTLRGLRLETTRGVLRRVLSTAERLAAICATRIVCVSESLRRRYVALGYSPAEKACTLAGGSSRGVDIGRFCASPPRRAEAAGLRARLGIPRNAPVVGFVGRFTRDKGVPDLFDAFRSLSGRLGDARLLMLGAFERGDAVPEHCMRGMGSHPRVVLTGPVTDPAPYYPMMDVLAFPSYREGFPNVVLEAAASEVPTVGYAATGTVDAVENGATGTLVPVGDVEALADAIARYLNDPTAGRRHGAAARQRVLRVFRQEAVFEAWQREYCRLLGERGVPLPRPRAEVEVESAGARPLVPGPHFIGPAVASPHAERR
jgi:glycosyltransferase involved in cell wall biosynthesis